MKIEVKKVDDLRVNGGISFIGLLQICFIVLKLCNIIHWKWVYVLMPFIACFALSVIATIGIVIYIIKDDKDGGDGLC